MIPFNDRRPGGGLQLVDARPYFPGNDKSKPSQGKLFKDPKPTDEHRYQRGYTPERMREVQGMVMNIRTGEPGAAFTGPAGKRQLQETIARSTTPASEHVEEYNGDKGVVINTGRTRTSLGGAAGNFQSPTYANARGVINIGRHPDSPAGRSMEGQHLMHELGHYRSALIEGNESADYDTPEKRGQEEAFADDNMVSRWRPDPRDVRRDPGNEMNRPQPAYEFKGNWEGRKGFGVKGFKAYTAARTTPNMKAQTDARWEDSKGSGWQPELGTEGYSDNPAVFGRPDLFHDRRRG